MQMCDCSRNEASLVAQMCLQTQMRDCGRKLVFLVTSSDCSRTFTLYTHKSPMSCEVITRFSKVGDSLYLGNDNGLSLVLTLSFVKINWLCLYKSKAVHERGSRIEANLSSYIYCSDGSFHGFTTP